MEKLFETGRCDIRNCFEKKKVWKNLSFATKWNVRDILRHKSRSFMTLFGIVSCMLILIASFVLFPLAT